MFKRVNVARSSQRWERVCVCVDRSLLPSRLCHCCGSHLLEVHFIWALEVSDDAAGSPQRNHNNINIPVGAGEDKQRNAGCTQTIANFLFSLFIHNLLHCRLIFDIVSVMHGDHHAPYRYRF